MKYLVTVLFLVLISRIGETQPMFNSSEFIQIMTNAQTEDVFSSTDVSGLAALISTKGANVSWSLGTRTFTKSTSGSSFPNLQPVSAGTPFASDADFSAATHFEKTVNTNTTDYSFYEINSTGFYFIGIGNDSTNGKQGKLLLTPPAQFAQFPLQYGTTWSSTSVISGSSFPGKQGTWQESGNCDGWGTLTTPSSASKKNEITASEQALRVKTVQQYGATYNGIFYGTSTYEIAFYGQNTHSMDITTDANDVPSKVSYTAPAGSNGVGSLDVPSFTVFVSPNPISGSQAKVSFTVDHNCKADFSLTDALGREVQPVQYVRAVEGQNIIPIDPTKLSTGTYFLRVNAEGMTATRKLIITK